MIELLLAAAGALLGIILEAAAVRDLRGKEYRRLPYARLLAAAALAVLLPLLFDVRPGQFMLNAVLAVFLCYISLTDLMAMLIRNRTLLLFGLPIVAIRCIQPLEGGIPASLLGAAGAFIAMAVCAVASRGQIGGGDVKLYALLGFVFGWEPIVANMLLACLYAAAGTGILIALRKKSRKDPLPFGPYIALSSFTLLLVS